MFAILFLGKLEFRRAARAHFALIRRADCLYGCCVESAKLSNFRETAISFFLSLGHRKLRTRRPYVQKHMRVCYDLGHTLDGERAKTVICAYDIDSHGTSLISPSNRE